MKVMMHCFTWTVALGIHANETNTFSLKLNPAKHTIRNVAMIRTTRAMLNVATQSPVTKTRHYFCAKVPEEHKAPKNVALQWFHFLHFFCQLYTALLQIPS